MRRLLPVGMLFLMGCANTIGPVEHFRDHTRVDDPLLTIPEQQRRGRDQLAMPDPSANVAPRTYAEFPSPTGR